jgi:hypothetical protein
MPNWVIEGHLATSPRPGFRPGPEATVPLEHVHAWVKEVRSFGVASILCLISDDQLPLYRHALPQGLLSFYEEAGFRVAHLPAFDGMTEPYTAADYDRAWQSFLALPKPVLVHCSAGMDRTFRVVNHIVEQLQANGHQP